LLSPTRSFFTRIFFTLVPFTVLVSVIYTILLTISIHGVEDYVIREYLEREYEQLEILVQEEGENAQLPSTSYLKTYWHDDPALPEEARQYAIGYYELDNEDQNDLHDRDHANKHIGFSYDDHSKHLLISPMLPDGKKLYMILNEDRFSSISQHDSFLDSLLFIIAMIIIIASCFIALVIARLLSNPVKELAKDVSKGWQTQKQFHGFERKDEIGTLSRSFTYLVNQLKGALETEKAFTRHASHEMRTPLSLIRNSLSVLKLPNCDQDKQQRNFQRIETACANAEAMVDVFLCLGRENESLPKEHIPVIKFIRDSLEDYEEVRAAKNITIHFEGNESSTIISSPSLLKGVISNLLRNALTYGKNEIRIRFEENRLIISNPIENVSPSFQNYGYGLEIVNKICQKTGWQFDTTINQQLFTATVKFGSE